MNINHLGGSPSPIYCQMSWHRLGILALVGIGTFAVIALAALLFISLIAPTVTPARMVAFLSAMFAVTGGVIAVIIWAARDAD